MSIKRGFFKERGQLLLILILVIATFLRFFKLDYQSLWYEELETLRFVLRGESFFEFLSLYIQNPDFHPPAMPILLRFVYVLFSESEWALKFLPALFGVASVYLVYLIGERVFNKHTGLLGALLMGLSGSQVYYSQEVRYTPVLVFLTLLFYFLCLRTREKKDRRTTFGLIACGVLASYLHYSGFFFSLFVLGVFSVLDHKDKELTKLFALSGVAIVILFGPWIPTLLEQAGQWSIYRSYNQHPNLFIYFLKMLEFSFLYQMYCHKWLRPRAWPFFGSALSSSL